MKILNSKIFLLFFLLTSCSYTKNVWLLNQIEIKRENYIQTIPFDLRKDIIVVKARLNADTIEREFIFDTGAFNSKLESNLADYLGLETFAEKENSTAQGISKTIEVVQIDSLILGETTVYNVGAGKLTYGQNSASSCLAESGIIGANLIKLAHWKIDYEKQILHFSDSPFAIDKNSIEIPFKKPILSGTPKIKLKVEGKIIENVLFDVGYNGGLILPISFANRFDTNHSRIIIDNSTSGIYGTNTDSLIIKKLSVTLDETTTKIPVEFSSLNKALLGNEFLKHFLVIINYDNNKIYLQKKREVIIEDSKNFLVGIHSDSLWVVTRSTPNLPIKVGDKLLSINEKVPKDLFSTYCDYLMNINKLLKTDSLTLKKLDGSYYTIENK